MYVHNTKENCDDDNDDHNSNNNNKECHNVTLPVSMAAVTPPSKMMATLMDKQPFKVYDNKQANKWP